MKITSKHLSALYDLTAEQFNAVEMHSFLNLINVIQLQLENLKLETGKNELFSDIIAKTSELARATRKQDRGNFFPENLIGYQKKVLDLVNYLEKEEDDHKVLYEIQETSDVLKEIFCVMTVRAEEIKKHTSNPGQWITYTVDEFKNDFNAFFHAVETNSKGRYRIVQNIARQEPNDYLVHFEVDSERDGLVIMPLIFKDVIRDLIANARKYSDPGGRIFVGIYQKKNMLRVIVEDNGMGIPKNEIDRIFDYGYRATNVRHLPTMGGGFGLTKALYITVQLNGDLWIESEEDAGTKITIEIPVPEKYVATRVNKSNISVEP
jgi:signal transduction histidine kinase